MGVAVTSIFSYSWGGYLPAGNWRRYWHSLPTDEVYRPVEMWNCYLMAFLVVSTGYLTW